MPPQSPEEDWREDDETQAYQSQREVTQDRRFRHRRPSRLAPRRQRCPENRSHVWHAAVLLGKRKGGREEAVTLNGASALPRLPSCHLLPWNLAAQLDQHRSSE